MKSRQAKKIWLRPWNRVSPYWWNRMLDFLDYTNRDHRISKAKRMIIRKNKKECKLLKVCGRKRN